MLSSLVERFFSTTFFRRYSVLPASCSHSNLIESKPSSFPGREKLANAWFNADSLTSKVVFGRNQRLFSSSVSVAFGGSVSSTSISFASSLASALASSLTPSLVGSCPSSLASSLASSFASSFASSLASNFASSSAPPSFLTASSFFSSSSTSILAFFCSSIFFLCSSNCFCLSCTIFFRAFSANLPLNIASSFCCFSCNNRSIWASLNSWLGSPITTRAVRLKRGPPNLPRVFLRSSGIKLALTSMTT
mmetsp:Transcript_90933/g.278382  ORF Transcript_90933/g.278382 Transcript_90933/m.278382 type:complete len:249 (-) Transcript_90933:1093-1839(-)